MNLDRLTDFYKGKRVFVTGHTGFKGTWLCKILSTMGANVYGYALPPETGHSIFDLLDTGSIINSEIGDVRDYQKLSDCMKNASPDYVFHLAAQPIVRESYRIPRETYEINVMGTVNVLECVRHLDCVRGVLNVTTDKVYENDDTGSHAFKEHEKLDGFDPYSNSKSCSELVTHSYKRSFFDTPSSPAISTARAGNVIGGGDFAKDRIIPDCVRAAVSGECINIRNSRSVRPYQHVLEPLSIYLTIVMMQEKDRKLSGYYNVGPDESDCVSTGAIADCFVRSWGKDACWKDCTDLNAVHEASFLKLDCEKIKQVFGWKPVWHIEDAVRHTVDWYKLWHNGGDLHSLTEEQIRLFFEG